MVHTRSSRSISFHVASRTSPDRAAVNTRNSNARLVVTDAVDAHTVVMAFATSPWGNRSHVLDEGLLPAKGLRQDIARRVVRPVAHRDRPFHHGADPLPHASGGGGLRVPDRSEDRQHIGGGDRGDRHRANARERIGAQTARPVLRVLGISPAGALLVQHTGGGRLERELPVHAPSGG